MIQCTLDHVCRTDAIAGAISDEQHRFPADVASLEIRLAPKAQIG